MDKQTLLKKLFKQMNTKRAKDYTFASLFFIVFSIFVFFAIRPSLVTAFTLKKQEEDLSKVDASYEAVISRIVTIQSSMETYRDDLHLFSEAVPSSPNLNRLIRDIEDAAATSSVSIDKFSAGEVKLVDKSGTMLNSTPFTVEATASFENLLQSIEELYSQRRLKRINKFRISRSKADASDSASLKFQVEVEGYYL